MTEKTAGTRPAAAGKPAAGASAATEFERLYRANVDAVTAYFARRTADPQLVADLTADTFVAVITGFASFDPRKGTARAWLFGIAGHVYAAHCQAYSNQQHKLRRLAGRRELDQDQVEELLERIDAERAGRGLLAELARLPERDRAVIDLVDIAGLRPQGGGGGARAHAGHGADAPDAGSRAAAQAVRPCRPARRTPRRRNRTGRQHFTSQIRGDRT